MAVKLPSRTERRCLGGAVMRLRQAYGIKQDTIAQKCEIHPAYLSNIERGKRQPSIALMVKLAEALSVDLDDISYLTNVYVLAEDAA